MDTEKKAVRWQDCPFLCRRVSFLNSHRAKEVAEHIELGVFLFEKPAEYLQPIMEARQLAMVANIADQPTARDKANELRHKMKIALPCAIVSAVYEREHTTDAPHTNSGLLCIDIDRKENLQIPKEEWKHLPQDLLASSFGKYVAFIGQSVSGWEYGGFFAIIAIPPQNPTKDAYRAAAWWFNAQGVKVDTQAANLNHCRCISAQQPDVAFVNPEAVEYPYTMPEQREQPKLLHKKYVGDRRSEYDRLCRVCDFVAFHGISLAENFEDWTKIGFAIASEFGDAGEMPFYKVAGVSSKFKERENEYKWRNACNTASGKVTIATFWWYCKQAGVDTKQFL